MTAAKKTQADIGRGSESANDVFQGASSAAWNKRILVLDDEVEIGKIYSEILSTPKDAGPVLRSSRSASNNVTALPTKTGRFDFDVTVVNTAEAAINKVKEGIATGRPYAMGFFDVRLGGGMDGVEVVAAIQKMDAAMYAVFVTAYNDRTIDAIMSQLGESRVDHWDYMNKPFNSAEIQQKARNFVALWNFQKEREEHASLLSDMNRRVLESERVTSVAAVARGVAHEFGNLLMQIMGKADISRNKPEDDMRRALEGIVDASQRAHEILDRFNHLSDTKSKSTAKTLVELGEVVGGAIDLMNHQFKKTSTNVQVRRTAVAFANLHSTSVLQVLVNLFINSMHAMGDHGRIEVEILSENNYGVIRVRDTGPGVSSELIDKVLEPFFTTKGDKGTGLGLAISREIIEIDHQGEFRISNHPEGGFQVEIRIPSKAEAV